MDYSNKDLKKLQGKIPLDPDYHPQGPSLDMDEDGDPVAEGFGRRLVRDLEIEKGRVRRGKRTK